ncbi:tRNA 2-thiocytidine biosynthesis TtcA family protein [Acidiferrobacter sp.]|uniref:tRNA 2-thiocytidine biosynthesis TtcA family protein n=1 Tax=Acidiferrobacter sp. TaxID=1872107 RepID=UPI0026200303|nr:tRNA 2-thiocytidine biosynthesis TtcA family protein [Acidiferrobacter sp.]
MIHAGDRVLLGVSGGKDSLSLLQVLRHLQSKAPLSFDLGVATVDPGIEGFDPAPLIPYMESLGVPYFYERQAIAERAKTTLGNDSFCSYCARMRRGTLYRLARDHGYNVLALAQHLDDIAESFLMSAFHAGTLHTMRAHYQVDAGDLRVIRPFVYVRERQLRDFAREAALPVIADNCPACFRKPTERAAMKALLAAEEARHKGLFRNLLNAMRPLLGAGESS